jgi:hypothetical protein
MMLMAPLRLRPPRSALQPALASRQYLHSPTSRLYRHRGRRRLDARQDLLSRVRVN